MIRTTCILFAAGALALLAGCATPTTDKSAATADDDKVLVTGSRIPVKDRTSVKAVDNRETIDQMMQGRNNGQISPKGN